MGNYHSPLSWHEKNEMQWAIGGIIAAALVTIIFTIAVIVALNVRG